MVEGGADKSEPARRLLKTISQALDREAALHTVHRSFEFDAAAEGLMVLQGEGIALPPPEFRA